MTWPLIVVWMLQFSLGQDSPLLDYGRMDQLRRDLAGQIVEIEVKPEPQPGMDPDFVPWLPGQGVCLDLPGKTPLVLASMFLVDPSIEIRARTAARPEWVELVVVRLSPLLGLALLRPSQGKLDCVRVTLADESFVRDKALLFSVDAPATTPNVFWGFVEGFAEPPMEQFFLTAVGLPLSYPLFTAEGKLVAMNVRAYTPQSVVFLAATANQIRQMMSSLRRSPAAPVRAERRDRDSHR